MSKAILVIDMPKICNECLLHETIDTKHCRCRFSQDKYGMKPKFGDRPKSCPLKKIPEYDKNIHYPNDEYVDGLVDGWNNCLDTILADET